MRLLMAFPIFLFSALVSGLALAEDEVSYALDVRKIIATNCFECHGPDEDARKADLRLDTEEGPRSPLDQGAAIVPGDLSASELWARINDSEDPMPPVDSNRTLTAEEKDIMRRWIEQGADYQPHWAFTSPTRPELPAVQNKAWVKNPIDQFVLNRLEKEDLSPAEEADRHTLARRVSLDLTGLPPTPEQVDRFLADKRDDAYEHLVDDLLASPHYGERWARPWLDLARYSDTNGYEKDRPRSLWPYREWVVNALNDDLPFDQFTIEQLAGDMLPHPTPEQLIATGFHRNTMLNEEGGIDPLEYRFHAVVDRVSTTGTTWMGLTTGCAQCHTHKYDPITHTDYFALFALLNNADEPQHEIRDAAFLARQSDHQAQINKQEAQLIKSEGNDFDQRFAKWRTERTAQAVHWAIVRPEVMTSNLPILTLEEDGAIFASGDFTKRDEYHLEVVTPEGGAPTTALRIEAIPDPRLPDGGSGIVAYEGRKGNFFLSEITVTEQGKPLTISGASFSHGSGRTKPEHVHDGIGSSGWQVADHVDHPHHLVVNFSEPIQPGTRIAIDLLFERHFSAALGKFRLSVSDAPIGQAKASISPVFVDGAKVDAALANSAWADLPEADRSEIRRAFLLSEPSFKEARKPLVALLGEAPKPSHTLIFRERPDGQGRPTHRHHRGEYGAPKELVEPAVPVIFPSLPEGKKANRLTLAKWLVSERNPLVGRVVVNRAWQALFGQGIVTTSADFGTQSALPSHPELLDWLACEFPEQGWSMKKLHRLIVTSATYRQSSEASEAILLRDPENTLLARGARFRVEAEMVRDIALAASGLLSDKRGGPSVYPPQPQAVMQIAYSAPKWNASTGPDRYRRSLYTFSKRTAPFAAYAVFDAPTGESCLPRRGRSNTPLQSLTLLNDEMFIELSRALAERVAKEVEQPVQKDHQEALIQRAFRHCLTRPAHAAELAHLVSYYTRQVKRLDDGELKAATILGREGSSSEAALAMTCRILLNLDETITRP